MKKTLNLLTLMLIVSGSTVVTVACSNDNKEVKSYLDWYKNEIKCNTDEEIYETEWGYGVVNEGIILYCSKDTPTSSKASDELESTLKKYNQTTNYSFVDTNEKKEWGTVWNGQYPKGYFRK